MNHLNKTPAQVKQNKQLVLTLSQLGLNTAGRKYLFNVLVGLTNRYDTVYVSQENLSVWTGLSRPHVNVLIQLFEQLGLITKVFRGVMKTCLYKLADIFNCLDTRRVLKHLIPAFKWVPLALLMADIQGRETNLTQYIEVIYNYSKPSCSIGACLSICACAREAMQSQRDQSMSKNILIKLIGDRLKLSDDQMRQLSSYPETVLQSASKAKSKGSSPEEKIRYFFGICRNLIQRMGTEPIDLKKVIDHKQPYEESREFVKDNFGLKDDEQGAQSPSNIYKPFKRTVGVCEGWQKQMDSWNKLTPEQLVFMKQQKLSSIYDANLRKYFSDIFDNHVSMARWRQDQINAGIPVDFANDNWRQQREEFKRKQKEQDDYLDSFKKDNDNENIE